MDIIIAVSTSAVDTAVGCLRGPSVSRPTSNIICILPYMTAFVFGYITIIHYALDSVTADCWHQLGVDNLRDGVSIELLVSHGSVYCISEA